MAGKVRVFISQTPEIECLQGLLGQSDDMGGPASIFSRLEIDEDGLIINSLNLCFYAVLLQDSQLLFGDPPQITEKDQFFLFFGQLLPYPQKYLYNPEP